MNYSLPLSLHAAAFNRIAHHTSDYPENVCPFIIDKTMVYVAYFIIDTFMHWRNAFI